VENVRFVALLFDHDAVKAHVLNLLHQPCSIFFLPEEEIANILHQTFERFDHQFRHVKFLSFRLVIKLVLDQTLELDFLGVNRTLESNDVYYLFGIKHTCKEH